MPLIDLTQTYRDGMFSQHLFPPVQVSRCIEIASRGLNVTCLNVVVHHGTHLDAPCHFLEDGRSIAQIALEDVTGPAVGLSVQRAAGEAITARDLENQTQRVEERDIVFIHTGWGAHFSTNVGRYSVHPFLGADAASWLSDRKVKLVAFDVPTPDMPEPLREKGFNWPIHHQLLGADVLIGENLDNLERVAGLRFRAFAFPIPIEGGDGSPVRFVAEVNG
jgi:kynurenine formamidase